MLYFIIVIAQAVIFGVATKVVIENKGYDDNWFWWGFFFGLIALIVACAKPQNIDYSTYSSQPPQPSYTSYPSSFGSNLSNAANKVHNEQVLAAGGWKCNCGRVHASYISSCSCGKSKSEVEERRQTEQKKQEEIKKQADAMDESSKIAAIKGYKELMDAGIISQEEFEAKKKQLLGLYVKETIVASFGVQNTTEGPSPIVESTAVAVAIDDSKIKCTQCGTVQNAGRRVCWECGATFVEEE